jgi:integrase
VYGVLRRALNDAVRKELLTRNPASADFVDAPRVPAKEPRALSVDEVRRLLDVLQGDALEPLVIVAITTGLRQGELLGLAWEDISDAGLRVRYELVRRNGRYHREEPKTPRSRRAVPLPPRAIAALKEHRDRLIAAGFTPIATGPVFCTAKGDPLNGTSVTHRLQKVMARVGITDGDFRMLRRTYASRMFEAGVSDRTIADIMGHTQTAVTHGHYIASGAGQDIAVAAAERLLG